MKFSDVVEKLGAVVAASSRTTAPQLDPDLNGVTAIEQAQPHTLSYVEGEKFVRYIAQTTASALILPMDAALQQQVTERGIAWVASPQPRLVFAQAIALFYRPFRPDAGIHPTAVIHPTATLGQSVHIGPHAVIQANVTLGDEVCIHPNVVVYPDVTIGDRTTLHANCVIHERTQIGSDCMIQPGAVVGSEGFGFVPIPEGWYKMEQSGYVVLEDGVEIGSNATIDRPAVGVTRLGRNTKLDNLVHIGHGCEIGENCALAAQGGLSGGVRLGNRVILGGQVGVANNAVVGDGVQAGAKAGIHSSVKPQEVVMGLPAMPYKDFLKISAAMLRLPDMYRAFRQAQSLRKAQQAADSHPEEDD